MVRPCSSGPRTKADAGVPGTPALRSERLGFALVALTALACFIVTIVLLIRYGLIL